MNNLCEKTVAPTAGLTGGFVNIFLTNSLFTASLC